LNLPAAPVLRRELLEHARRASTHWLRVAGAAGIMFLCWRVTGTQGALLGGSGRPLFLGLNKLLFLLIWVVAPVMTADCLSREKREGTIGLLFLTPLRPWELILGKVAIHALRGLTVMAAAVPVLVLPILVGGVGVPDAVRMLLFHLSALGMALASGILASALVRGELAARALAAAFTLLNSLGFLALYITSTAVATWRSVPFFAQNSTFGAVWLSHLRRMLWNYGLRSGSPSLFGMPGIYGSVGWGDVGYAAAVALGSGGLVFLAGWFATRGLVRTWRPQAAASASRRRSGTPAASGEAVLADRQRRLDQDPFEWLVGRLDPVTGHRTVWAVVGLLVGALLAEPYRWPPSGMRDLALVGFFSYAAALGFARCLPTGSVELLAVTPISLGSLATAWFARCRLVAACAGVACLAGSAAVGLIRTGSVPVQSEALCLMATLPFWLIASGALVANVLSRGGGAMLAVLVAVGLRHLVLDLLPSLVRIDFRPAWILELLIPLALTRLALGDLRRRLERRG
jgi:ABC-type transport system involved in multi-copper enzyme maturation permease subunit